MRCAEGTQIDLCRRRELHTLQDYGVRRSVSGGLMGAAINVGEVYAHLVRDLHAGAYSTPGFEHALHNARLIEAVRRAAERGERQRVAS